MLYFLFAFLTLTIAEYDDYVVMSSSCSNEVVNYLSAITQESGLCSPDFEEGEVIVLYHRGTHLSFATVPLNLGRRTAVPTTKKQLLIIPFFSRRDMECSTVGTKNYQISEW